MVEIKDLGLDLVVIASIISCTGVYYNNILLDHHTAMLIWRWSNILFLVYFVGRAKDWWDGGLPDWIMAGLYGFFVITNEMGLN